MGNRRGVAALECGSSLPLLKNEAGNGDDIVRGKN